MGKDKFAQITVLYAVYKRDPHTIVKMSDHGTVLVRDADGKSWMYIRSEHEEGLYTIQYLDEEDSDQ